MSEGSSDKKGSKSWIYLIITLIVIPVFVNFASDGYFFSKIKLATGFCDDPKDIVGYVKQVQAGVKTPVVDASVELVNDGVGRLTRTDKNGRYIFESISEVDSVFLSVRTKHVKDSFQRDADFCVMPNQKVEIFEIILSGTTSKDSRGQTKKDNHSSIDATKSLTEENDCYSTKRNLSRVGRFSGRLDCCEFDNGIFKCKVFISSKIDGILEICSNSGSWRSMLTGLDGKVYSAKSIEMRDEIYNECAVLGYFTAMKEVPVYVCFDDVPTDVNGVIRLEVASSFGTFLFDD